MNIKVKDVKQPESKEIQVGDRQFPFPNFRRFSRDEPRPKSGPLMKSGGTKLYVFRSQDHTQ